MKADIEQLLNDVSRLPQTRLELLVSLCALNYANLLLKILITRGSCNTIL